MNHPIHSPSQSNATNPKNQHQTITLNRHKSPLFKQTPNSHSKSPRRVRNGTFTTSAEKKPNLSLTKSNVKQNPNNTSTKYNPTVTATTAPKTRKVPMREGSTKLPQHLAKTRTKRFTHAPQNLSTDKTSFNPSQYLSQNLPQSQKLAHFNNKEVTINSFAEKLFRKVWKEQRLGNTVGKSNKKHLRKQTKNPSSSSSKRKSRNSSVKGKKAKLHNINNNSDKSHSTIEAPTSHSASLRGSISPSKTRVVHSTRRHSSAASSSTAAKRNGSITRAKTAKRRRSAAKELDRNRVQKSSPKVQNPKTTIVRSRSTAQNSVLSPRASSSSISNHKASSKRSIVSNLSTPPASIGEKGPFYSPTSPSVLKSLSALKHDMQMKRETLNLPKGRFRTSPVKQRESECNDQVYRFLFSNSISMEGSPPPRREETRPKSSHVSRRRNTLPISSIGEKNGYSSAKKDSYVILSARKRKNITAPSNTRPKKRSSSSSSGRKSVPASMKAKKRRSKRHPSTPRSSRKKNMKHHETAERTKDSTFSAQPTESFVEQHDDLSIDFDDEFTPCEEDEQFIVLNHNVPHVNKKELRGILETQWPESSDMDYEQQEFLYSNSREHLRRLLENNATTSKQESGKSSPLTNRTEFWRGFVSYLLEGLRREKKMARSAIPKTPDFIQRELKKQQEMLQDLKQDQLDKCLTRCLSKYSPNMPEHEVFEMLLEELVHPVSELGKMGTEPFNKMKSQNPSYEYQKEDTWNDSGDDLIEEEIEEDM